MEEGTEIAKRRDQRGSRGGLEEDRNVASMQKKIPEDRISAPHFSKQILEQRLNLSRS